MLDAYREAYLALFDRRAEAYQKVTEEIRNRPEWEPLARTNKDLADSLIAPLRARIGAEADRAEVDSGTGLGNASLTEMESDLAAVDGLRSSALVKLQELSMGGETKLPSDEFVSQRFSIVPFRPRRIWRPPSGNFGTRFRSSSTKALRSFWSDLCLVRAKFSRTIFDRQTYF